MATIDPSIAMGIRPFDPLEGYGKAVQLKSLLGQQRMQEMQLAQAEQDQQQQRDYGEALKSSVGPNGQLNYGTALSSLAQRGNAKGYQALLTQQSAAQKADADLRNTNSQVGERDVKTEVEKAAFVRSMVSQFAAKEDVTNDDVIRELMNAPPQFRENAAMFARMLPGDPSKLRNFLLTVDLKAKDRLEALLPRMAYESTGKSKVPVDMNAQTNPNPQPLTMTTTPGEDQTALTARAGQAVTMRGQNMTDARSSQANETQIKALGKPPPGYMWGPLDENGNPTQIAARGGPADTKLQGVLNQDTQALTGSISSFDRLATAANEVLKHPGLKGITGMMGALPNLPGGEAANAEALLGTLKSQVGFGVLQDMRNNSKTGGALGAVSDAEGKRLEANLAALDKSQSFEQYQANLQKIVDYADKAKDRVREAYNLKHGGQAGATQPAATPAGPPVPIKSDADYNALPKGTRFVAPDGRTGVKS